MSVEVLNTPQWDARQALTESLQMVGDGDGAMIILNVNGSWQVVTSSVTAGDLLIGAEYMRMMAMTALGDL